MKRNIKRALCLALVLLTVLSFSLPASAAANIVCRTGKVYIPLAAVEGKVNTPQFWLAYGNKAFTLKGSEIKLNPGTTDARLASFARSTNTNYQEEQKYDGYAWEVTKDYRYCQYNVGIRVSKPGTAKLSYKINGVTYKVTLIFQPYKSSVKTITLTGVNGGKSFASLTKNASWPSKALALNATTKSAKLKVTAANSWKIKSLELYDVTADVSRTVSCKNGWSSASLSCGTLNAKHNYELRVQYTLNGAWSRGVTYQIRGALA